MRRPVLLIIAVAAVAACATPSLRAPAEIAPALSSIDAHDLLAHTRVLASDEFEGRLPGTKGEQLTVEYLGAEFRRLGLKPGNPDGSYVQEVPLAGITSRPSGYFRVGSKRIALDFPTDAVAGTYRYAKRVEVRNSDVVFVGYGVQAPEYDWDDYKGLDVRGKTLVMLVNDPAVPDSANPGQLDPRFFNGKAMTYYGRWTYKYEIASRLGAKAVMIVHETGPAGYGWNVVSDSWTGEQFTLASRNRNMDSVPVQGWLSLAKARELFAASGLDFEVLKQVAVRKDFHPVALDAKATFRLDNRLRTVQSRNIVARLPGADPQLAKEHVVYTAHWDHLGRDTAREGDQIFNGAADNATGTAGLLELAEAFARLPTPPRRSILFLAVTAEEQGLLGARWYTQHPLYPLRDTVANLNIDVLNQWGRTKDVVVIGVGQSTLEDVLAQAAADQGRVLVPDPEAEKGFYYRSDHFEFAKVGVPALYADPGTEYPDKPSGYGMAKRQEYTRQDYHQVSDEVKQDWDLSGAVEDLQLLFRVGYAVAQDPQRPEWKAGSEFKAVREASLSGS